MTWFYLYLINSKLLHVSDLFILCSYLIFNVSLCEEYNIMFLSSAYIPNLNSLLAVGKSIIYPRNKKT